jgi:hypothetical protein
MFGYSKTFFYLSISTNIKQMNAELIEKMKGLLAKAYSNSANTEGMIREMKETYEQITGDTVFTSELEARHKNQMQLQGMLIAAYKAGKGPLYIQLTEKYLQEYKDDNFINDLEGK